VKPAALGLLFFAWAAALCFGMTRLVKYEGAAGASARAPGRWPEQTALTLDTARPTLVMFAHPRCPCTRASIGELAILMSKLQGKVTTHVLFAKPAGTVEGWEQTDQLTSAARIPGVEVHVDVGGRSAERFGARTSGQALLYSTSGQLLFSGGITGARSHMGDNAGLDRIVSIVRTGDESRRTSAVFGCPIFGEKS
jgi:hypothetical protein